MTTQSVPSAEWGDNGPLWQILPSIPGDDSRLREMYGPGPWIFSSRDELPIRAYRKLIEVDEHTIKALIIVARDKPQYLRFEHYSGTGVLQIYSFEQFLDMDQPNILGDHAEFDCVGHRPVARLVIPMEKPVGEIRTDKELFGANA